MRIIITAVITASSFLLINGLYYSSHPRRPNCNVAVNKEQDYGRNSIAVIQTEAVRTEITPQENYKRLYQAKTWSLFLLKAIYFNELLFKKDEVLVNTIDGLWTLLLLVLFGSDHWIVFNEGENKLLAGLLVLIIDVVLKVRWNN